MLIKLNCQTSRDIQFDLLSFLEQLALQLTFHPNWLVFVNAFAASSWNLRKSQIISGGQSILETSTNL